MSDEPVRRTHSYTLLCVQPETNPPSSHPAAILKVQITIRAFIIFGHVVGQRDSQWPEIWITKLNRINGLLLQNNRKPCFVPSRFFKQTGFPQLTLYIYGVHYISAFSLIPNFGYITMCDSTKNKFGTLKIKYNRTHQIMFVRSYWFQGQGERIGYPRSTNHYSLQSLLTDSSYLFLYQPWISKRLLQIYLYPTEKK